VKPTIHRALVFQGGGSLGAYEAGAYKAICETLSREFRAAGRGDDPIFHIVSGTSIGAINATLLVSYVKENKTWEGSSSSSHYSLDTIISFHDKTLILLSGIIT